ncbi:type II secretion system minor pseudopilin GspJ [Emcibacter nanhaiensis]|uniref:Type II secretion system protein J n=1 Tax=Emcibacter nanhaiensis TaxID=1505037 RepID=A0A501PQX3_9PROT|nr:type II secretion system minor pseudopilin GspJ [Emcibacter nanhaiensis]TPD62645.1 type II secretion system protein GspJ [Emcibacter nanhaiensis]
MSNDRGFTLVEVMVSLTVFALLSVMGIAILSSAVSSQESVEDGSERLREIQVSRALLKSDFMQLARRQVRDAYGGPLQNVFAGYQPEGRDAFLTFVRSGWINPGQMQRRAELQRVSYELKDGDLVRRTSSHLDPAKEEDRSERVVLSGIKSLETSFYINGQWFDVYESRTGEKVTLPQLVSVEVEFRDGRHLKQIFITSQGRVS